LAGCGHRVSIFELQISSGAFCTAVHSFPQPILQISLAKKKHQVYRLPQIEPGSLKNLTAQLNEGATA
jgi:hypothetical protein